MKDRLENKLFGLLAEWKHINEKGLDTEGITKEILSLLPDISSLIAEEECDCYDPDSPKPWTEVMGKDIKCPNCKEGKVTRPATLHDVVEALISILSETSLTGMEVESGGILKLKGNE